MNENFVPVFWLVTDRDKKNYILKIFSKTNLINKTYKKLYHKYFKYAAGLEYNFNEKEDAMSVDGIEFKVKSKKLVKEIIECFKKLAKEEIDKVSTVPWEEYFGTGKNNIQV